MHPGPLPAWPPMSKTILIVESDTALSQSLRSELEQRGFTVEETSDGKGSVELIRRQRPDLVLMAVDLSAGQNGYILCGKLKKDDELKAVPVVIMGNPDGFAQHSKLKTRADDYLAKPVDVDAFLGTVGNLIGMPEPVGEPQVDESLTAADLLDGDAEEIAVEADLDPLDDAFADLSSAPAAEPVAATSALDDGEAFTYEDPALDMAVVEEPVEAPVETVVTGEEDFASLDVLGGGSGEAESALSSLDGEGLGGESLVEDEDPLSGLGPSTDLPTPPPSRAPRAAPAPPVTASALPAAPPSASTSAAVPAPPAPRATSALGLGAADAAELRSLSAQVAALQASLEDAQARLGEREGRVHELESELERKSTELETARGSGSKADKEFFALREAGNRKDKEILRLKAELNEKDQELLNLREREVQLEQQANEGGAEVAKRDAQLKTLTTRAETLMAERRKAEQQLLQAREEARNATARASALEAELGPLQEQLRVIQEEAEAARGQQDALASVRTELEAAQREAEELRAQAERAYGDLQAAQAESEALRSQLVELQSSVQRNDERVAKLYARIRADEKLRDRTKKALAIAQQLLEENGAVADPDEAAA